MRDRSLGFSLGGFGSIAEAKAGCGHPTEEVVLVVGDGPGFVFGCAYGYHQRDEMVFARVRGTRGGGLLPREQSFCARIWRRVDKRPLKPIVEPAGWLVSAGAPNFLQIVIAETATDDQYAFIPQRRECSPHRKVQRGIVAGIERQLDQRKIFFRI